MRLQAEMVINQRAKAGIASHQKMNMALRLNSCSNKKAPHGALLGFED
jgi:hypothetical protein